MLSSASTNVEWLEWFVNLPRLVGKIEIIERGRKGYVVKATSYSKRNVWKIYCDGADGHFSFHEMLRTRYDYDYSGRSLHPTLDIDEQINCFCTYVLLESSDVSEEHKADSSLHQTAISNEKNVVEDVEAEILVQSEKFRTEHTNFKNATGDKNTKLHHAARWGDFEAVVRHVEEGIDKDASGSYGYTAMHYAAEHGHLAIVKYLVVQGANEEKMNDHVESPLCCAVRMGHFKIVKYLVEQGADKEVMNHRGFTLLHFAAKKGRIEIIKYLVEQGADKEKADDYGMTPLDLADYHPRYHDIIRSLTE
jgi:ankyrin repeat protein